MATVESVNMRAATTINTEIHKQRLKVLEIFRTKCKANLRSALTEQVPETLISALEHSFDLLSEHIISAAASVSTTPRFSNSDFDNSNKQANSQSNEKAYTQKNIGTVNSGEVRGLRFVTITPPVRQGFDEKVKHAEVLPSSDQLGSYTLTANKNTGVVFEQPVLDKDGKVKTLQERHLPHHHQDEQHTRPHPQLEKVDLFDSDIFHHTPSSSNNSSPASQTHIRSQLRSAAMKHHISMPDIPSLSPDITTRTRPTSANTKPGHESNADFADLPARSSPRDDMKVIEARIRLAKWTRSGEMPWKSSSEKSNMKNLDTDGFVKPGLEAEQWLRTQRETSHVLGVSNECRDPTKKYGHNYNYILPSSNGSEDSVSCDTNVSFVTLEPEVTDNSELTNLSLGSHVGLPKSSKNNSAMHNGGNLYAEGRGKVFADKQQNGNDEYIDHNYYQNFGSQGSVMSAESGHPPTQKQASIYSKRSLSIPTSTPLTKVLKATEELRTQSEESINNSKQWKVIGGAKFFEHDGDLNKRYPPEHEPEKHLKTQFTIRSPQKSSRSSERNNGNLAVKSAEFPSDLSRITEGSNSDQPNLWRYKSLEDLIPNLKISDQEREEMKDIRLEGRSEGGRRDTFDDRADGAPHERTSNQKRVDFVSRPGHSYAPVKAMTSEFWEQLSEEDREEPTGQSDHRSFPVRQPGFSKFDNKVTNRIESDRVPVGKICHERSSPTRHKTSQRKRQQSPDYKEKFDTKSRNETVSQTHAHSGSRSEPRSSRRQAQHLSQLPTEETISGNYRIQDVAGDHRIQVEHLPSNVPEARSAFFMKELTGLRRSQEELNSPHKSAKNSKITRSSSEQSLHTIQYERDQSQGQGSDNHIDALVSAYTTQSYFDLRHFQHDEQF